MTRKDIAEAAGWLVGEIVGGALLAAGETGRESGGKELLGLERKPTERKGKTTPEAALLTVREDLMSMRERLLKGVGRKSTLADLDYTIDQLDNALGEM